MEIISLSFRYKLQGRTRDGNIFKIKKTRKLFSKRAFLLATQVTQVTQRTQVTQGNPITS
jgi:hypothetical protein